MDRTPKGPMLGAWKRGYQDFLNGKPKEFNPYQITSFMTQAFWRRWNEGWENARSQEEKRCLKNL